MANVPLLHDVNVLVLGSGIAAVRAALAAHESGASVVVVSDLSYFGEESAGALKLQPTLKCDDTLYAKLFPAGSEQPVQPGHVKHQLELALFDADIPFYYYARPVSLIKAADNTICGAVIASRTSLYAIGARMIIDATRHGLVTRMLPDLALHPRIETSKLSWTILSPDAPTSPEFETTSDSRPFKFTSDKDQETFITAHTLSFNRPTHNNTIHDRAGVEHALRSRLSHATLWGMAEIMVDSGQECLTPKPTLNSPAEVDEKSCRPRPMLFVINSLLPLTQAGLKLLEEPAMQMNLASRVGKWAASAQSTKPTINWQNMATCNTGDPSSARFEFAPSFVRSSRQLATLELSLSNVQNLGACDVAVAGGGTGGASAGIAAARSGAKTIVIEIQHGLGGVGTMGLITNYYHGNRSGFTTELDRHVSEAMGRDMSESHKKWNPQIKDLCLQQQLLLAGGSAWLGSFVYGVQKQDDFVTGLLVSTPFGAGLLQVQAVVDASGNADVAAAAGAPCRVVNEYHVGVQGAGLSPNQPARGYRNSDHTFIDDTDLAGVTHAFVNARAKFTHEFDVATLVDTRERRQIIGDIELSPLDFMADRTFPDTINRAMSNFDTHGFTVHPLFVALPPDRSVLKANVPFRCLLPQGLSNVLVTGLGMSAHRDALPVIRMQADVQNQGYAAGVAAARSVKEKSPLRKLDVRKLQEHLVEIGNLEPNVLTQEDSFPLSDDQIATAMQQSLTLPMTTAIVVAHPAQSIPHLRLFLLSPDETQRRHAALLLGLLGDREAAGPLIQMVAEASWDEGWNYRGMGQFGLSMSTLDSLIVAMGRTGSPLAVKILIEKIESLDGDAAFSHCRAVSIAASALGDAGISQALAALLAKPGIQGHEQVVSSQVVRQANDDLTETQARNLSLRELLLARGLYLCGDIQNLGQRILETYTNDLRGPYARHAQAVLSSVNINKMQVM